MATVDQIRKELISKLEADLVVRRSKLMILNVLKQKKMSVSKYARLLGRPESSVLRLLRSTSDIDLRVLADMLTVLNKQLRVKFQE